MRLILQFCLLMLVPFGAETRAWGKVDVGLGIVSGGLPILPLDKLTSITLMAHHPTGMEPLMTHTRESRTRLSRPGVG